MDDQTLKALNASIKHWEDVATTSDISSVEIYTDACPLCRLFFLHYCEGCPVYQRSGKSNCENTPYRDVAQAKIRFWKYINNTEPSSEEFRMSKDILEQGFRRAARAELAFLRSLLPKDEHEES